MAPDDNITEHVFVSYTHDSEQHRQDVLDLADKLTGNDGIHCEIDQYHEDNPPAEGWAAWSDKQVRNSAFVLIVCTNIYKRVLDGDEEAGKRLGSKWESSVITQQLYKAEARNLKFIPIILRPSDKNYIPDLLGATNHYDVSSGEGYDNLCRRITRQPRTPKPRLGKKRTLLPRKRQLNP